MPDTFKNDDLIDAKKRLLDFAWGHSHLGMNKEAVLDCKKLVELDADDPSSFIELGFYYERNGEVDKATECYRNVMKRFPQFYASYTNMGHYFQVYKKRDDIATVCYEKALELNPEDAWSLNNIGTIFQKNGMWQEALSYYEMACKGAEKEGSVDYKIIRNLAWAYHRCKKYEKAWSLFDYLVKEHSDDAPLYSEFGCVNYKLGQYENALKLFETALSMYPENRYCKRLCRITAYKLHK